MQLNYDIKRSINAYPPITGKGIKNNYGRQDGSLSRLITTDENGIPKQPRQVALEDNQYGIVNDFKQFGVDYTKEPMIVEQRGDGQLELISGFGRLSALLTMGVNRYFYEVLDFESLKDKIKWKRKFNTGEDHRKQGTPNTLDPYKKGLVELKNYNCINWRDDDVCRAEIRDMADGTISDAEVETVLDRFRQSNTREENVLGYTTEEANKRAKKLGQPTKGYVKNTSNPAWDRSGYVRKEGNFSSKIYDIVELYDNYGAVIEIVGFIMNPVHDRIGKQRKDYLKAFNRAKAWMKKHLKPEYHDIVVFKGFLPHIITADPKQGGLPMERALVNVDGSPV
jgi:hypothetical protein